MFHENGSVSVADVAPGGVVYAVDETGAARVEADDGTAREPSGRNDDAAEPLADGELVAAFE